MPPMAQVIKLAGSSCSKKPQMYRAIPFHACAMFWQHILSGVYLWSRNLHLQVQGDSSALRPGWVDFD